jgi:two-component system sensor histidine kinase PilS (NtrC family)
MFRKVNKVVLRRLQFLMLIRVIIISIILGITVLLQLKEGKSYLSTYLVYLYFLVGIIYFLTFIYALLINFIKTLVSLAYTQIIIDVLLISFLIYITGGTGSVFNFFYILSIISASIFLGRRGSFLIASQSSFLYGALINLEYYKIIKPEGGQIILASESRSTTDILYFVIMNIIAFYLVAFLSSHLSEQVKSSQRELHEKQIDLDYLKALHNNIVQSVNTGILTIDKDNRITSFNKAAEEITGFKLNQIYYYKIGETFPGLEEIINQSSPIDPSNRYETEHIKTDGEKVFLGFSFSPLKDTSNNDLGKIIIFQDLTKLKEMEDQIKRSDRLAASGQLAAGIAHEIRNPLASMSGSIQILKNDLDLTDVNKQLMDILIRETERIDLLIDEFLLFASPDEKKKEKINLYNIILDILQILKNDALWNKNIVPHLALQEESFIKGNFNQIKQLFFNIIINALQAMTKGGELKILMDSNHNKESVKITISDSGSGIPQENIKKIFDPFYTTKEKGVGLGLSIVHKIIENHNGKIIVNSEQNKGTSFNIYLPQYKD